MWGSLHLCLSEGPAFQGGWWVQPSDGAVSSLSLGRASRPSSGGDGVAVDLIPVALA